MSRSILFVCLCALMVWMNAGAEAKDDPLCPSRWEQRIILVNTAGDAEPSALKTLRSAEPAIRERHVLWFVIQGQRLLTNFAGELPSGFGQQLRSTYFEPLSKI